MSKACRVRVSKGCRGVWVSKACRVRVSKACRVCVGVKVL